ncbi:type I phosphomannose isomerase catalytic subunit [Salinimicrobium sediminilitoris]|uniref:type I phosphomannose isomerase catalytic subunit n=1 Tax=Salinimicrobium sediminilitoris TaxID=2876715 RepID=UPI001E6296C5|nr:type I phosphomannose isomerase catalytic subunit [Salinimicrobium sediminilitoris]MCC8359206.1 class I mannose-6-phosphate isomerase [Salinimicrobium sediminilitoris]
MLNYPIRFEPILKEKIWGGNKLKQILHKPSTSENTGESWEISGVKGDISVVENGPLKGQSLNDLLERYKERLLGKRNFKKFGEEFPLLIKFIDAKTELSVQLHPHDSIARERHNSFGKTEMWYIMQADEGAEINVGFKKSISEAEYLEHLNSGRITELLNFEKVQKGDSFFINTGKVHAIGAGVLLAEIQQTSDITYRIYDWDRVDSEGNSRELHTDLALDAIDFERKEDFKMEYSREENSSTNIANCEYFTTNFLPVKGSITKDYSDLDSFVIFMCVSGEAEISIEGNSEKVFQGQTLLIPAENSEVKITANGAELLEVYVS